MDIDLRVALGIAPSQLRVAANTKRLLQDVLHKPTHMPGKSLVFLGLGQGDQQPLYRIMRTDTAVAMRQRCTERVHMRALYYRCCLGDSTFTMWLTGNQHWQYDLDGETGDYCVHNSSHYNSYAPGSYM